MESILADVLSKKMKIEVHQYGMFGQPMKCMIGIEDIKLQDDKIIIVPQQDLFRMDKDDGR